MKLWTFKCGLTKCSEREMFERGKEEGKWTKKMSLKHKKFAELCHNRTKEHVEE